MRRTKSTVAGGVMLIGIGMLTLTGWLCIAFMPVATAVFSASGPEFVSVVLYAGVLALTALVKWVIWQHATRGHRLVAPDLERRIITYDALRPLLVALIFGLSIGIAWISPDLATAFWALIMLLRPALLWHWASRALCSV